MSAADGVARPGAELLVDALLNHGIDTIFGFPGDTSIHFYDVIAKHPQDIRHVLARDERHAAYMADGYARTLRRVGVCEAPSGAGAVYLASGLGEAFASGIPVLAITTDNPHRSRGTSAISEIDQMALFSAVTKWRRTVDRAADLPSAVAEAVTAATSGRPGPVALIIPENVLDETADVPVGTGTTVVPARRPQAPAAAVSAVAAQIAAAERPAILVGGGVHLSGAWHVLTELAEHAAIPVGTSIHGKGALAEDHPFALGVVGANGARDYANEYLRNADFVLFAGTRANATDTAGFTAPPRSGTRIAHIDLDPERAGRNYPGSTPLVADVGAALEQIRQALPAAGDRTRNARRDALRAARQRWIAANSSPLPDPGDQRLQPRDVVRALHGEFGGSAWVVADAGTPTPFIASFWESSGGAWRVVIPRGHGPLGFAISAAIGVAVAHPGERVLCLTTEGSVAMGLGDWETAGRLGLPITFVVLDNTSLGWIKMIQHLYAGGRYFAVDPGRIDPVLLANGMGLPAARALDPAQLSIMIKDAAGTGGPSVIHVRVPEHMENPPPVEAWHAALAGTATQRPIH